MAALAALGGGNPHRAHDAGPLPLFVRVEAQVRTVTARLVGATLQVRMGGDGPVMQTPETAVDALLNDEPVRIPAGRTFAQRVRRLIAQRALAGDGPSGQGQNWGRSATPGG